MISYLEGKIVSKNNKYAVILASSVGYKVFSIPETLERIKIGQELSFWTHLSVKDDALDLFGFLEENELEFFGKLITVSGIGPKTALGIMSVADIEGLSRAIASGNIATLTKVYSIGKKSAEKIILELKDKFAKNTSGTELKDEIEALEALKSLGYSHKEAREALRNIPENFSSTSDRIKQALKILG
jgi:Holliday junction DNA helicase RuvA